MDDNLNVKLTDFGFATEILHDEELYGERCLIPFQHCVCDTVAMSEIPTIPYTHCDAKLASPTSL